MSDSDKDLSLAMRIKVARTIRNLRQGDVAYLAYEKLRAMGPGWATFRVHSGDVSALETGGKTSQIKTRAILEVLGIAMEATNA